MEKEYIKSNILTLPEEKIIVQVREYWVVVILPVVIIVLFSALGFFLISFIFLYYMHRPTLFVSSVLLLVVLSSSILIKIIADWYYHLYIITNRRILEVCYSPLFSEYINDVLLDQVRITEVDVKIKSIVQELLNIGDVVIVFDRPSHEETFIMTDIQNPSQVGGLLANSLEGLMHDAPIWFRPREATDVLRYAEDIYRKRIVAKPKT